VLEDKAKREACIAAVTSLLESFCASHFSHETAEYVRVLWTRICRKRNSRLTGVKPEVWASAVVYVIARLNFLFDPENADRLTSDTICNFFGTKKSTVSARATAIEKGCRIRMGEPGLCSDRISDSLTIIQLPNGLVVPLQIARQMGLVKE
jgi:hypothetical protein